MKDRQQTALLANPGADMYGSDRMVIETVDALVASGWAVVATTPVSGPLVSELESRGAEVVICPMAVIRKRSLKPRGAVSFALRFACSLFPAWRLLRRVRPDVVYVNTVTVSTWLLLARVARVGSICHVHEGEVNASRLILRALNAPLFLANKVVVNSGFSRDVLGSAFASLAERSDVVYNAVAGPDRVVEARATLDAPCRMLCVGRLIPRKGPQVAIDALARLRLSGADVHLDLVGSVSHDHQWFQDELERQIDELGLGSAVTFHGFQRNVWPYLAACDIALVPSIHPESFGNTAVEASLAARPRIVSDFPGLSEATHRSGATLRVTPDDADALAGAVIAIMDDWLRYRTAASDDAARARRMYSVDRYAQEVVSAFEPLLRRPSVAIR